MISRLLTIILLLGVSTMTVAKNKWETPDKSNLKEKLTPIQYKVTQKDGTEPPYKNKYWENWYFRIKYTFFFFSKVVYP